MSKLSDILVASASVKAKSKAIKILFMGLIGPDEKYDELRQKVEEL